MWRFKKAAETTGQTITVSIRFPDAEKKCNSHGREVPEGGSPPPTFPNSFTQHKPERQKTPRAVQDKGLQCGKLLHIDEQTPRGHTHTGQH